MAEYRNVQVIEAEVPLVRRLIRPYSLHVINDIVLDVKSQPIDLGQHAEMFGGGGGVLVDRHLQGGGFLIQVADQLINLGLRAIERVLGEVDSGPV